jgi:hypothetical protein
VSSAHESIKSARKGVREDLELRWVTGSIEQPHSILDRGDATDMFHTKAECTDNGERTRVTHETDLVLSDSVLFGLDFFSLLICDTRQRHIWDMSSVFQCVTSRDEVHASEPSQTHFTSEITSQA